MADRAMTQQAVRALRRKIAKMEGRLAECFDVPAEPAQQEAVALRKNGIPWKERRVIATGISHFDQRLGGGLPQAGLSEIHSGETRKAGAVVGFALAFAAMLSLRRGPLLWIGTAEVFREAGQPYAPGLLQRFGLAPEMLLFVEVKTLDDGLWVAEEAAQLKSLSAVILELRGNPARLDLTATRRLHHRAVSADTPVFLLRHAAAAEPTAAPVRLVVSPAPAGPRFAISGPLHGFIGPPAFTVEISKSPGARPGRFILEWNADERSFKERRPTLPRPVVPLPGDGPDMAPAIGTLLAFGAPAASKNTAHSQPSGKERAAHRRSRRAS